MSDQTQYPVKACVLTRLKDVTVDPSWWVANGEDMTYGQHMVTLPAVAIPLALLEDAGLVGAVTGRLFGESADNTYDPAIADMMRALAAELRSRAGIGEGEG